MKSFTAVFLIATLVAMTLIRPVRALALRLGAVSVPGGRHVHRHSTPRLGGVAVLFGVLVPLSILFCVDASAATALRADALRAAGLAIGGVLVCAVGFVDDVRGVRALHKLFAQILAASVAFACGFRIQGVHLPLIGDLQMGIFAFPITIFWIVGIVNAINLIDGLDGLAAGVAIFASITNFTVAYLAQSTFVAIVMIALLGATLGFLFHNFNPARIFMGDSGSYFIGFVLATCSLVGTFQKASTTISIIVPVLALGVPILDTLFAILRRFLERRPLFSPDRGHIHHRLLDMGITHRRAVLMIYGVSMAFTASAIALALGRSWQIGAALLGAIAVLVSLVRFVGYFEQINASVRSRQGFRTREVELLRRAIGEQLPAIDAATTDAQAWAALTAIVRSAGVARTEIIRVEGSLESVVRTIETVEPQDMPRELVSARFPLGESHAARVHVKFAWASEVGSVAPQCDILWQVATDVMARTLSRLGSEYAPETADSPVPSGTLAERARASVHTPSLEGT